MRLLRWQWLQATLKLTLLSDPKSCLYVYQQTFLSFFDYCRLEIFFRYSIQTFINLLSVQHNINIDYIWDFKQQAYLKIVTSFCYGVLSFKGPLVFWRATSLSLFIEGKEDIFIFILYNLCYYVPYINDFGIIAFRPYWTFTNFCNRYLHHSGDSGLCDKLLVVMRIF